MKFGSTNAGAVDANFMPLASSCFCTAHGSQPNTSPPHGTHVNCRPPKGSELLPRPPMRSCGTWSTCTSLTRLGSVPTHAGSPAIASWLSLADPFALTCLATANMDASTGNHVLPLSILHRSGTTTSPMNGPPATPENTTPEIADVDPHRKWANAALVDFSALIRPMPVSASTTSTPRSRPT